MKIGKITVRTEFELIVPLGKYTDEQIAELTPEVIGAGKGELLAGFEEVIVKAGGRMISSDVDVAVVEV